MKSFYRRAALLLIFVFTLLPFLSEGHAPNQSYIFLKVYKDSIGGIYEITIGDINKVFDLGLDKNASLEDVKPHLPAIEKYILEHLSISSVLGEHPITLQKLEVPRYGSLGNYLKYDFKLGNVTEIPDKLNFKYDAVFDVNPSHRAFQVNMYNWKAGIMEAEGFVNLTFTPNNTEGELDLTKSSVWRGVWMMIKSGAHHIWIGIDHILFILALILPSVVRREEKDETLTMSKFSIMGYANAGGTWSPVERFKPAFIYLITIITFFTIAHSITLSAAGLGVINLPSRLVESVIALSIGLAAFHNIRPIFKRDWVIAFAFGLFHGFGFASVLGEVGLAGEYMVYSLLGFNVGVELGQLAIIVVIFPILYWIRNTKFYPKILVYGSILLILMSLYWMIERILDIDLPLGKFIMDLFGIG